MTKVILIDNDSYVKSFVLNSISCVHVTYANGRYYVTIFGVGPKDIEFTLTATDFNKASLQNMEDAFVTSVDVTIAVYNEHLVTFSGVIKETNKVIDYIDDLEGTERWIRGTK